MEPEHQQLLDAINALAIDSIIDIPLDARGKEGHQFYYQVPGGFSPLTCQIRWIWHTLGITLEVRIYDTVLWTKHLRYP